MRNWYQNNLKLFFSILLFPPIGVYGLAKKQTEKKSLKVISMIVSGIYLLLFFMVFLSLLIRIIIGMDKLNYQNGISKFEEHKYDQALVNLNSIEKTSEFYEKAQIKINEINDSIAAFTSRKQAENEQLELEKKIGSEQLELEKKNELKKKEEFVLQVEKHKNFWADSIVKDWNGTFILSHNKPIGDTIFFQFSKGASESFKPNRETYMPIYKKSYEQSMKAKFGPDYVDQTVIDFIQDEKIKKENIVLNARKEKILKQFSPWNGSHRNLEKFIKKNMHDPGSYDHIETTYQDKGSYILVQTKIRGKNALGVKVISVYTAKVDLEGNILEIE